MHAKRLDKLFSINRPEMRAKRLDNLVWIDCVCEDATVDNNIDIYI